MWKLKYLYLPLCHLIDSAKHLVLLCTEESQVDDMMVSK